jgi:prophage antirepressor-like protein
MSSKKEQEIPSEGENKIDLFQKSEVRKVHHDEEWWFSIVDIIRAITETPRASKYWSELKGRLQKEGAMDEQLSANIGQLPLLSKDGKSYDTDVANVEGVFRLVQSIPSKKAEPFKKWLAKVGFERLQEIENPDLAIKRAVATYRAKGYPDDWIEDRITNKASRLTLTATWKEHGMEKPHHIAILTDAVSIEALGINTNDHKKLKGLMSQDLRDHMTPLELTLIRLGEQATTEIVRAKKPRGLIAHKDAATTGGGIAGKARKEIEAASGRPVISSTNFLTDRQKANNEKKRLEAQLKVEKIKDRDSDADNETLATALV